VGIQGSRGCFLGPTFWYGTSPDIASAGQGLKVAEGSNAKQGTAVLNGTTAVVVGNTSVTANSRIFLTINTPGAPPVRPGRLRDQAAGDQ